MTKKYEFTISTNCVGARTTEEVEIEFEGSETEEEIDKKVSEVFNEWVWENLDAGWTESE